MVIAGTITLKQTVQQKPEKQAHLFAALAARSMSL
jgi:hypothetical protein